MQKNEAGFKMSFKKRNPDFRKPPKKITAAIPATGDLRKHDQPKRVAKKSNDMETSSSSEEDVLEKTRKAELENQKSEQAKMVEMALLEQVMSGQIDVMDLLKSGQVDSSSLKEKLQKQMQNLDGVPTSTAEPTPAPAPVPAPSPPVQKQAAYNPLMRNRDGSNPPSQKQKSDSKSKSKRKKATGSISSESSESSSDESIDTDISSESDSDEDSHKLAKKVKKLKAKNKKLQKKVKSLKKKLKEKKSEKKDEKQVKSVQRNAHGQIEGAKVPPRPQPPPPPQTTGALAPMTPQQYTSQQSQVRRQYDPQTGQYRDVPEAMPRAPPGPIPPGIPGMPPFPPIPPLGQMPTMPPGPIPPLPMSSGPLPPPSNSNLTALNPGPAHDNEIIEIKNIRGNSPVKNYPSDDDLYLDVFKEKEKEKPKTIKNLKSGQMPSQRFQNTLPPGQRPIESLNRGGQFHSPQFPQQVQYDSQPQKIHASQDVLNRINKSSHHERGYKPSSSSSDDSDEGGSKVDPRKRKSSDRGEVVVRSNAAKNLIKDFYEEEEVAVVAAEGDMPPLIEHSAAGKNTKSTTARGVTYSGKCIFCQLYHTVSAKSESSSLCQKGKLYLEKYKSNERQIQDLRTAVKENTDKLVSLKNKRELMAKVIVENDVRKNERAQRMESYKKHIDSLPLPVKVSQEFGRKVVKAQNNQQNLGNQLQAAIDRGNSAAHSDEQNVQEYGDMEANAIRQDNTHPNSYSRPGPQQSRHETRYSSESEFTGRNDEGYPDAQFDEGHYGQRQTQTEQGQGYRQRSREPVRDQQSLRDRSPAEQAQREQYWREHQDPPPRSREPRRQQNGANELQGRAGFDNMRTSPRPPFRSAGLLKTPAAAGPPQRPPPALLRTPGSRPQHSQPAERAPRQHSQPAERAPRQQPSYNTARPPYGWSGERGR